MGPVISLFKLTGELQPRLGSGLPYTVPRGVYLCGDGRWVGVSASSDTVAARVMSVLGVADDQRFSNFSGRMKHRIELEQLMTRWCAQRTRDEVVQLFSDAQAAVGPVFDMSDIAHDAHFAARDMIPTVGDTPMQGLIAELSATPGELRWAGRLLDADGDEIRANGWGKLS
jgi:crotonobetainyl-CoA:carnitine CoA-transferase CaiB-like acyl-CoA transferase